MTDRYYTCVYYNETNTPAELYLSVNEIHKLILKNYPKVCKFEGLIYFYYFIKYVSIDWCDLEDEESLILTGISHSANQIYTTTFDLKNKIIEAINDEKFNGFCISLDYLPCQPRYYERKEI